MAAAFQRNMDCGLLVMLEIVRAILSVNDPKPL